MGGSSSKTTTDVVTDIAVKAVQKNISRCVVSATQEQLLSVKDVLGNVTISGVRMRQGASVNMNCVMEAVTQSAIQNSIANDIAQWAESQSVAVLGALGTSRSEAESNIRNQLMTSSIQDTTQEAFMQAIQKQGVEVAGVSGNVVIGDVSLDQSLEMVAKAMITGTAYSSVVNDVANKVAQTAKSEQSNPISQILDSIGGIVGKVLGSWTAIIIVVVIVIAVVLGLFIKYFFSSGAATQMIGVAGEIAEKKL
jgi:hypothetical protein